MSYARNPRKRIIRGTSSDELRRGGRRTSEELDIEGDDMPFVRLGSSSIGTAQDVVQRIGNAIIGGDFGGNARGERAIDIQITRFSGYDENDDGIVDASYVASGDSSVVFGRDSRASGVPSVAIGVGNVVDGASSVGLGMFNEVSVGIAAAIGYGNIISTQNEGAAFGVGNSVSGFRALAVGRGSVASNDSTIAVGAAANVSGYRAIGIGAAVGVRGSHAIGLGVSSSTGISAERAIAIGYQAQSLVTDQAVIAATALKMQTVLSPLTYESVITTSAAAPVTGNLATWADVDRIGDAGVALSSVATIANVRKMISMRA